MTENLSRNPKANPEPIENYDEEYVTNWVIPLLEFINKYGSITDETKSTTRTDIIINYHKANSQSEARLVQKLQTSENKRNICSLLLPAQSSIGNLYTNSRYLNYDNKIKEMGIKTVKSIEREEPSGGDIIINKTMERDKETGRLQRTLKAEQKNQIRSLAKKIQIFKEDDGKYGQQRNY